MIAAVFLAFLCVPAEAAGYPSIRSDPRVELLSVVRLLAGDAGANAGFFRREGEYQKDISARLGPLSRHPVVERWQELEKAGLGYVPAYQWVLTLGALPELLPRAPAPEAMSRAAGGAVGVEEFRLLVADFAKAADFSRVYAQTAALREPLMEDARLQSQTLRVREDLEGYAGAPAPDYEVIVSAFIEPGVSVTAVTHAADGRPALTSLTGPEDLGGKVVLRLSTWRGTLWAEAIRVMLRSASEAAAPGLKASRALFVPVAGRCAPDWEECALREASFAAAGRLLARVGEREASAEVPVKYARVGMPHLAVLMKTLEEYERAKPGLPAFYPKLVGALSRLAVSVPLESPFSGGIADALADPGPCVFILPAKPGSTLWAAIQGFGRAQRLCDAILTPEFAASRGLSDVTVIAAGGLTENAWIRARWKDLKLPLSFEAQGLVLGPRPGEAQGRVLTGALSVATVARNPENPARPALVFAALDDAGAARALSLFSGRFDFEIFDGTATVKAGLYEKSRLPWRPK